MFAVSVNYLCLDMALFLGRLLAYRKSYSCGLSGIE